MADAWMIKGPDWHYPLRIRIWQELANWVNEVDYLPLFAGGIPDSPHRNIGRRPC